MHQLKGGLSGQVDWPNIRGNDWALRFQLTSGGVPIDLTGYTFVGEVRQFASDPTPLLVVEWDLSEGNGWVNGKIKNVNTNIPADNYTYRVKWVTPDGTVKTLFGGACQVS